MCGINFIIDRPEVVELTVIEKMNKALLHRGPDHQGHHQVSTQEGRLLFGATRLKICDLHDRANQPFLSEDERYTLIYNGEIYNYTDLRNELVTAGFVFKTQSDTEVLLNHLIRKGQEGICELEGMFSFCFYDKQLDKVIIARDKKGIKPLFYYFDDHYFVASSELKSLFSSGIPKKELDSESLAHYVDFRFAPKPATFYKNVNELLEGHCLLIESKKAPQTICYDRQSKIVPPDLNDTNIVLKTEELIVDSLHTHTSADVPVGLYLSGGVDSTLLLALHKQHGLDPISSFSIVNTSKSKSFGTQDQEFAKKAARQYGHNHIEVPVDNFLLEELDHFIEEMDQPIGDSAYLLTYLLSLEAKKEIKVALSGAGADEVFGGYNRHWAFLKYLDHYDFFSKNQKLLQKASIFLPTGFSHPFRKKFQLLRKFAAQIDQDPKNTFINFTKTEVNNSLSSSLRGKVNVQKAFDWAINHDRHNYLISDVLAMSDAASMKASIELRVPYLDEKLTNYMSTLPSEQLMKNGKKWILKSILNKYDGKIYSKRSKEGLGLPFGAWIRENKVPQLDRILSNENSLIFRYISYSKVMNLLKLHCKGALDNSQQLWSLLVLGLWLEKNFAEKEFENDSLHTSVL